ncbi:hypothetical protein SFRURICE_001692, partial [Spodoptera frugiperda]
IPPLLFVGRSQKHCVGITRFRDMLGKNRPPGGMGVVALPAARHNLPHRCNSCKPGSTSHYTFFFFCVVGAFTNI